MLYHWEEADILKITKSIKLLVKMQNVSFTLQKNCMDFLVNSTKFHLHSVFSFFPFLPLEEVDERDDAADCAPDECWEVTSTEERS